MFICQDDGSEVDAQNENFSEEEDRPTIDVQAPASAANAARHSKLPPGLLRHQQQDHGLQTEQEYRKEVFSRALGDPLQPVTAQVLRSRLQAYKDYLSDDHLSRGACASCARFIKNKNLVTVRFPSADEEVAPEWLGYSDALWAKYKQVWFDQVNGILNINMCI